MSGASIALPRVRARIRLLGRRLLLAGLAAIALIALYMLWFRDSSLVAVKNVKVEGIGRHDAALERALTAAGKEMTTLHVRQGVLAEAAKPYPLVAAVSADPSFPSGLTIQVTERRPVALIGDGSTAVAVAGDGTILRGLSTDRLHLASLPLSTPPKGPRLRGTMLQQAQILGAAPPALRRYADSTFNGDSGVGVRLSGGVELRFGDAIEAAAKWRAAAAVLADPQLGALDYVDLSVPSRPAVGGSAFSPPAL